MDQCCRFKVHHGSDLPPPQGQIVLTRISEQNFRALVILEKWEESLDTGHTLTQDYRYGVISYSTVSVAT